MSNQKITFDQILDTIVDKSSISKTFARTLIKELTALIQDGLLKDNTVTLAGFGIFKLHQVPERNGRNIQNGQPIIIPAHRKVLFKPEKHIRELINKKYEDLLAVIPGAGQSTIKAAPKKPENKPESKKEEIKAEAQPAAKPEETKPEAKKSKDPTESEITLSAIAKSLDSMIKDEPKKRTPDELSDEPVLKDDIMGLEQKEREAAKMFDDEDKSNKKKLYIGASLIALLLILLLFMQFGGDEPEVEIVENEKPAVESVSQKEEKTTPAAVQKTDQKSAIKYETITSVKGDNLWDLAYRHYKDGYLWPLILQANKDQISNPDLIEPGEKLKIPVVSNSTNLNKAERKMLSDGHLTAYFEYREIKDGEALNHLFVANRYDHENVKKSLTKIDNSDYESIKSLSMK